jgi:hypothetical protein
MASALDRAVLAVACGEQHTVVIATAPISATTGERDMDMWLVSVEQLSAV